MRAKHALSLLTLFLFASASSLWADSVNSRISAVTVYMDRAVVTRTASNDVTTGEHTLIFENLPAALMDQSLQASGRGVASATILDVTTKNIFVETTANESVKAIEDQIRALQKQRRMLDDRSKILEEQRGFVQRMMQASTSLAPGGSGTGPVLTRPTLDEWQRVFTYTEENLSKIAAEQLALDTQREDIQAKESALNRQLNELRGAQGRRSKTVAVRVAVTTPGNLDMTIRYAIPNASWTPSYDARLRSMDRTIQLSYFGIVRNGTGEDWNDVSLTLSTARPNVGGSAPELRPWIADVLRVPTLATTIDGIRMTPVDAELGRGRQTFNNLQNADSARPPEQDASTLSAAVEAGVTSATFKIPVPATIPGNNVSQRVAINDARFAATLQYQSTPKVLEAAFLSAYANNTSDYPLLAGPMNTYLDDTFIASSNLKTVMPGEKYELALGVDDGISVKRRLVNRFTEDTGLTNKTRRITYEILVTITNNKTSAERVVFKEPTPISRDEKIVVKLLTPQEKEIGTLANPKEITREEDGKLVWRVNLKPGEKREFSLKVSVEHPNDLAVTGIE